MLTTPHSLIGMVVITRFPNFLGIILAIVSHFLLDFFIPHWNPHLYTEFKQNKKISSSSYKLVILDGLIGVSLTLFFMWRLLPDVKLAFLTGLGSFMGVFPDSLEIPYYFLGYKAQWMKFYADFSHKYQSNGVFVWGMITQILVVLACLKVLL
ncbi:MAG TPA: hypothetical protein VMW29_04275 [Candidatus Bathyarchaeia archaeon]|nr:hypothetical protein [Candidatus Bathyarchaeia archaeon]